MNIAAQPPVQADQTIYLKDYQKPSFLVESIHLDIQVYDDHTLVDSTMVMKRQATGALVFLGRDLELKAFVKLLFIQTVQMFYLYLQHELKQTRNIQFYLPTAIYWKRVKSV